MMEILVFSSGRADRSLTVRRLPPEVAERARIVVPHGEAEAYRSSGYQNVEETPRGLKGIGPSRQWALERAGEKLLMLDDDLRFDVRRLDEPSKFLVATPDQVTALFEDLERKLDEYVHVAVATREGGNRLDERGRYYEVGRALRVLGWRAREISGALGCRFDRLPLMEDMDMTLQLLRKGYSNCIVNYMVQGQGTSNAPGGCSQYRNQAMQKEAAFGLANLHRPHVRVVEVETKGAWWKGARTDVEVQWLQALQEGQLRAQGIEQKEIF